MLCAQDHVFGTKGWPIEKGALAIWSSPLTQEGCFFKEIFKWKYFVQK